MSIRLIAEVQKPLDVEVTVTITMQVRHWQEVVDALGPSNYLESWHSAKFRDELRDQLKAVSHRALGTAFTAEELGVAETAK